MSTESERRASLNGPISRLCLSLVDIFTGVVDAEVLKVDRNDGTHFILKVKKAGTQDD